jgi:hypothetical protein
MKKFLILTVALPLVMVLCLTASCKKKVITPDDVDDVTIVGIWNAEKVHIVSYENNVKLEERDFPLGEKNLTDYLTIYFGDEFPLEQFALLLQGAKVNSECLFTFEKNGNFEALISIKFTGVELLVALLQH